MRHFTCKACLSAILGLGVSAQCCAEFTLFEGNASAAAWFQAASAYATIGFDEFPGNTAPITDQYAHLGVHFTDTDGNWTISNAHATYPQDGSGLNGNQFVELSFDAPMSAFAIHFPGFEYMSFYRGEQKVFASGMVGVGGTNNFAGVITDTPFDRVVLHSLQTNPFGIVHKVFLDTIYFSTVPAPGGVIVFAGSLALTSRRRRA